MKLLGILEAALQPLDLILGELELGLVGRIQLSVQLVQPLDLILGELELGLVGRIQLSVQLVGFLLELQGLLLDLVEIPKESDPSALLRK